MATLTASTETPARPSLATGALVLGLGMAAVVGGALGFEHIGGYVPCKLCLAQRVPYYTAIPVMLSAALVLRTGPRMLATVLLAIGGALMAYAAYLGVHHSGVEWGWWAGPTDCGVVEGGVGAISGDNLLDSIDAVRPPSCNEAAGRFLGLSFAGWQVVAAVPLAIGSFALATRSRRTA